jgi:ABC-type lipoprotein release transport system permease subunit
MESKQREIGILRSLGMSRKDVLSIFAFQGLVVGAAVHGLAVFAAASIEPDLSSALAQAMGSSLQEVLPVRLMSWGALDVHLLGWMASVGFCLLGSTSAARRAYGIKLSEALYIKR